MRSYSRPKPGSPPETRDGDVWKPRPAVTAVDAELLEPSPEIVGERRPRAVDVVVDEHADAPRLAVALEAELGRNGNGCGRPQRADDRCELPGRALAEEGERAVEVLARDDPQVAVQRGCLPGDDLVERSVGQAQREEQAQPLIGSDATCRGHTTSSRLRVRSVRARCRAMTTERARIAARSPGKLNSRPRPPSGPSAWQ